MQTEPWISSAASAKFSLVFPPSNVMHISSNYKHKAMLDEAATVLPQV